MSQINSTVSLLSLENKDFLHYLYLYISEGDEISIHTLACASYQILCDILHAKYANNGSYYLIENKIKMDNVLSYSKEYTENPKQFYNLLFQGRNFFKHADVDLKAGITNIEFNSDINIFIILQSIKILKNEHEIKNPKFTFFEIICLALHDIQPELRKLIDTNLPNELKDLKEKWKQWSKETKLEFYEKYLQDALA